MIHGYLYTAIAKNVQIYTLGEYPSHKFSFMKTHMKLRQRACLLLPFTWLWLFKCLYMYNSMVPKFSRFSRDYSVQSWLLVADLEFLSSKHFNVDVVEFVQEHMILNEKF